MRVFFSFEQIKDINLTIFASYNLKAYVYVLLGTYAVHAFLNNGSWNM